VANPSRLGNAHHNRFHRRASHSPALWLHGMRCYSKPTQCPSLLLHGVLNVGRRDCFIGTRAPASSASSFACAYGMCECLLMHHHSRIVDEGGNRFGRVRHVNVLCQRILTSILRSTLTQTRHTRGTPPLVCTVRGTDPTVAASPFPHRQSFLERIQMLRLRIRDTRVGRVLVRRAIT
jgi:hypothetical protein